jgi:hypothetical protein
MASGRRPTFSSVLAPVARSTVDTLPASVFATSACRPSGVTTTVVGPSPTSAVPVAARLARSTCTSAFRLCVVTSAYRSSGVIATAVG